MADWKETRIGLLPNHWDVKPFEQLIENGSLSYGVVQPGSHREVKSVPIIRVNNIKNGKILTDDVMKVAEEIEAKYQRTRLKGGELLLTVVGSVGEAVVVPASFKDWNVARAVSVSRISDSYDKQFIKYCFSTDQIKFQMYGHTNDTVQPTLNLSSLKEILFPIPPLPEQQAIAEVLSSLDDKIDLLHRQNKTLEALAETLFRQWFVEEAEESWESGTLGDVTKNVRCNIQPTNIKDETKYIGLEHIERKHIALYSSGSSNQIASNKSVFHQNDVLFGKLRPYFHKVCFAPFDGVCSTDILVLRPKESLFFPYCLFAFFQKEVVDFSDSSSEGTRMPRTSWDILQQYPIAIPSRDAILRFNEFAFPAIQKIKQNIEQIHQLTTLRDTLLPKLMSGEVRVKIDEPETASAKQ